MTEDTITPQEEPSKSLPRIIIGKVLFIILMVIVALVAIILMVMGVGSLIPGFVLAFALVGVVAFRKKIRRSFAIILGLCIAVVVWRSMLTPSHDREWQEALSVLPEASMEGDEVTISGVRNFDWKSPDDYEVRWEERTYRLSNLQGVELILQPFSYSSFMAHTMMSFDFGEDGRLICSIEARKEVGEVYNPVTGGLNQYEIMYLFMDERDGLGIRAIEGYDLHVFPMKVDPVRLRAFFLSICAANNNIITQPKFYHILRDNCTTVWIQHADHLSNYQIGMRTESVLNGLVMELLHKRGAIDTDLSYDEAREAFRVDHRILEAPKDETFSDYIRQDFPEQ